MSRRSRNARWSAEDYSVADRYLEAEEESADQNIRFGAPNVTNTSLAMNEICLSYVSETSFPNPADRDIVAVPKVTVILVLFNPL